MLQATCPMISLHLSITYFNEMHFDLTHFFHCESFIDLLFSMNLITRSFRTNTANKQNWNRPFSKECKGDIYYYFNSCRGRYLLRQGIHNWSVTSFHPQPPIHSTQRNIKSNQKSISYDNKPSFFFHVWHWKKNEFDAIAKTDYEGTEPIDYNQLEWLFHNAPFPQIEWTGTSTTMIMFDRI